MRSKFCALILLLSLATACTSATWKRDPEVQAAREACGALPGDEQYACYERQAVERLNPDICHLTGMWIDDACLQAVYEAAGDPAICDRLYLPGVVPNCRTYYNQRTPEIQRSSTIPSEAAPTSGAATTPAQ